MTRIATAGTSSCATIAIAGFKDDNLILNQKFVEDNNSFVEPNEGLTPDQFYNEVLYPVSQPLGHTKEYPFRKLMELIDKSSLKTKLITATLNEYQVATKDGYWVKELEAFGFKAITKTKNTIGSVNTLFIRNPNEVK